MKLHNWERDGNLYIARTKDTNFMQLGIDLWVTL